MIEIGHILFHVKKLIYKLLIDDPRINRRVSHSDLRGKFVTKMTNRESLHEKLYYTFVPLHKNFFNVQIKQNSENVLCIIFYCLYLSNKKSFHFSIRGFWKVFNGIFRVTLVISKINNSNRE